MLHGICCFYYAFKGVLGVKGKGCKGLWSVVVVFPGHTHLLSARNTKIKCLCTCTMKCFFFFLNLWLSPSLSLRLIIIARTKLCISWLLCNSLPASGELCRQKIPFANGLNPDQDRQNVGPDLDTNCLTFYLWPERFLLEKSRF